MKRSSRIALVGIVIVAAGLLLTLRADSLATHWQPLGDGAWGGTTDVDLRQTYHQIGLVVLYFGSGLLAMAAWTWIGVKPSLDTSLSGPIGGGTSPEKFGGGDS